MQALALGLQPYAVAALVVSTAIDEVSVCSNVVPLFFAYLFSSNR
jgi:hypothetical protein